MIIHSVRRQLLARGTMQKYFSNLIQDHISSKTTAIASKRRRRRSKIAMESMWNTPARQQGLTMKHIRNSRMKPRISITPEERLAQQRSHAAHAISTLIHEKEYSEDCLRWTMEELNVNIIHTSAGDVSTGEKEDGHHAASLTYRQMYVDSVSSFCSLIVDQPSTINKFLADSKKRWIHTTQTTTVMQQSCVTTIEELLDQLILVGFGDLDFIKRYQFMDQNRRTVQEYNLRIEEKRKLARIREQQVEALKNNIDELHTKLAPYHDPKDQDYNRHDSVLLAERNEKIESRWSKQLDVVLKKLDERRYELQTTENQILQMQENVQTLEMAFSKDNYASTTTQIKHVLMNLCPAVAEYIRFLHKRKLDQYRTLSTLTDLTKPFEWYPRARLDKRKIIFHGG